MFFSFLFLSLAGDCGHRGWCDNTQSAPKPHTGVTQCVKIPNVCKLSVNGWCVTVRDRCELCRRDLDAVSLVPSFGWFVSLGVCRVYTMPTLSCRAAQGPTRSSQQGCLAAPGAYRAWHGEHGLTSFSFSSWHSLQLQVPLFLSVMTCHSLKRTQTNPLLSIQEVNLTACPLVQSCWKIPFQRQIWTPVCKSSVRKASRHCGLFNGGLACWATRTCSPLHISTLIST